jgi:hypothetical protein
MQQLSPLTETPVWIDLTIGLERDDVLRELHAHVGLADAIEKSRPAPKAAPKAATRWRRSFRWPLARVAVLESALRHSKSSPADSPPVLTIAKQRCLFAGRLQCSDRSKLALRFLRDLWFESSRSLERQRRDNCLPAAFQRKRLMLFVCLSPETWAALLVHSSFLHPGKHTTAARAAVT